MANKKSKTMTAVQNFYAHQSIFITGGTGFFGTILIEKLLRCCSELSAIYMIIRPKRGQDIQSRLETIFSEPIFDRLRIEFPNFRKKIIAMQGDCTLPGLGISTTDKEIIVKNVSIVFHVAAKVKMIEKLKTAVANNVYGTKEMIDICKCIHNLKAFISVSTLYSNCARKEIDEIFYEPIITGANILKLAETLDEKSFNDMDIVSKSKSPNTYVFTKAIAEQLLQEYAKDLPLGLFRPAIVMSTYHEPIPGWIPNSQGASQTLVDMSSGLLKTMHTDGSLVAELVPADLTINAIIVSAWDVALNNDTKNEPFIYNYCSTWNTSITWQKWLDMGLKYEIPTVKCIWSSSLIFIKNYYLYYIASMLLQALPAILIDGALLLLRKKTWAIKTCKEFDKYARAVCYFSLNEWKIKNNRTKALWQKTSLDDQKLFPFSMDNFDWDDFMKNCMMGIRIHIFKDPLDTIPAARKRRMRFLVYHNILKYTIIFFGLWTVCTITKILLRFT
ncbi:fatty acyl-CoA reductase wat-like [Belonocnema kinseyi]|uniref:fatty acyl-CoA reductase wat-like n=1 Tax=Belonocnema kinseyi TaxID=2817044 RepID=UPI00143DFA75|nr:fatty acyl-CoA reductase wat-like [Belonocnema kinseyi]